MKKILTLISLFALSAGLVSCKSKESAYHSVFKRAQERQAEKQQKRQGVEEITPAPEDNYYANVRTEKVTPADGAKEEGLLAYSVVIGSFQNLTNARSLKERMIKEGFQKAILAQNEYGMYRVIVTSFDTKDKAVRSRDSIKKSYAPLFSDAWILQRTY